MVFTKGFVIHHEQRQRHQCLLLFWKTANNKGFLYCFWTKQKLKQLFQFQGSSNDYYLQQIGRWVAKQKHLEIGLKPLVWCPGFFWGLQSTSSCTAHILPLGRSWKILHYTYGWNFSRCIFSPNIVTFFATLTAVFLHFLHWFYCFNYFYGSITCAAVGKTKVRYLKKPLNMDDFEVFSHFFPFCISSYKP